MLEKNRCYEIPITDLSDDGHGVGRAEGVAVFVPNAVPGDTVSALIIKTAKNYAVGRLDKVVVPSASRISVDCPTFERCGGCSLRCLDYAAELEIKQNRVKQNLVRIGGIDLGVTKFNPIIGCPNPDAYRNKAQFPFALEGGHVKTGLFSKHSHRVAVCKSCLLHRPEFDGIMAATCAYADNVGWSVYDEKTGKGLLRHIYLRGVSSGDIMLCLVVNSSRLRGAEEFAAFIRKEFPCVKSVYISPNKAATNVIMGEKAELVSGAEFLTERLCNLDFEISPLSFFQVNRDGAERLYNVAASLLPDGLGNLLDLYCGAGTIGLSLAGRAETVTGIEVIPDAVRDARRNAERNSISNAQFICADADEAKKKFGLMHFDTVITDPPRKGCGAETLAAIAGFEPENIIMVSCNSATLARDLRILCDAGYRAVSATPVDMFPRTMHVETAVLLTRGSETKN